MADYKFKSILEHLEMRSTAVFPMGWALTIMSLCKIFYSSILKKLIKCWRLFMFLLFTWNCFEDIAMVKPWQQGWSMSWFGFGQKYANRKPNRDTLNWNETDQKIFKTETKLNFQFSSAFGGRWSVFWACSPRTQKIVTGTITKPFIPDTCGRLHESKDNYILDHDPTSLIPIEQTKSKRKI